MAFFRQYIAPLFVFIVFAIALLTVSARIFLPSDLAAPAPIEDSTATTPPSHAPAPSAEVNPS